MKEADTPKRKTRSISPQRLYRADLGWLFFMVLQR
jgi:hypothetical protein